MKWGKEGLYIGDLARTSFTLTCYFAWENWRESYLPIAIIDIAVNETEI